MLCDAIDNGRHTWLMAPRRYGKTSLTRQVLLEQSRRRAHKVAGNSVDLLLAYDSDSVRDSLLEAIGEVSRQILPKQKQLLKSLSQHFRSLRPELSVGIRGDLRVRFRPVATPAETIVSALTSLDELAAAEGLRIALVLDEFQQLATLRDNRQLEASVRHAVERAQHVTYVFSGSHRHMLERMFEDASRPLYHLCERLELRRIAAPDYHKYLNAAAKWRWQSSLDDDVIEFILGITARHPYYLNALCGRLWRDAAPPTRALVHANWLRYVDEERHRISKELVALSPNQRAVLQAIAAEPTDQPRSKAFLATARLASASAGQAVQVLLERDTLHEDTDGVLRVLDPAVQWYLHPPPELAIPE